MRIFGAILAGLFGLAFGSFLNVCLSRWASGESIVHPRSHCRSCLSTLTWWENIPLVSYLFLRGRCRTCGVAIGIRYLLVELAVGFLWTLEAWRSLPAMLSPATPVAVLWFQASITVGFMLFFWILIALAVLDAEHLWLPDRLTWPGIAAGLLASIAWLVAALRLSHQYEFPTSLPLSLRAFDPFGGLFAGGSLASPVLLLLAAPVFTAAPLLLIRWLYSLIRRREGLGLGDVKLAALLGAWLGLPCALLALFIGVVLGGAAAVVFLLMPKPDGHPGSLATARLPLGTFLSIGGIVSALWGQPFVEAYLRFARF
ncbi:MAG TPA: prepilin peptidase [Terracidiphilus sp.]|jgi:leader peptidase (prepilin peptidase)/N-methyltransferase|nr:prepilin peptidase [Terracidiphilus sp.]